ncbi:FadR family transcriptional regulator [Gordonia sp. TBRC 11910]|uniref:FadR family transcriptional regulator n=1 Tax=Gordonia asplenii TaxID=2725283 RepID=A0A848L1X3_9ACTN|nr:FCD domain-containing protein [Gordonia asplenii]NMO02603.1 FadR family transcriptional regulator [Gordonia asplenii]
MPEETPRKQGSRAPQSKVFVARAGAFAQRTRAEELAAALDDRIRSERLAVGELVGTLDSLRAETGFAYSTVSEAVRLLRDRGILEIRPGRNGGLFVAESGPVVRMRHTLLNVSEAPETVADAIELRDHLEALIDVSAARHCTDSDAAELTGLLETMRAASTWDDFLHANWALHERIAAICPNEMARAVYVGTLGHLGSTSARIDDSDADEYRRRRTQIHVDLVDAITRGDEQAVREAVARHNNTTV